jgi:flagellar biogenesis protein FliO
MELNNGRESVLVQSGVDSTQTTSIRSTLLNEQQETRTPSSNASLDEPPKVFQSAIVTFLVMVTLLGGIWVWSKRKSTSSEKPDIVADIGQHLLGQGVQLKIVEINNEIWVLGLSASSLTLLHRYSKNEWQSATINQHDEYPEEVKTENFKAIYNLLGN